MRKFLTSAVSTLAAGLILVGTPLAQQTPPAKTPTAPAAAKPRQAPAAAAKSSSTAAKNSTAAALTTTKDKFSYALGMNLGAGLGGNLHKQAVEFDPNLVAQGLKDAMLGSKTRLTEEEARAVLMQVQTDVRKKQQEKVQQASAVNKQEGEAFLAANKSKEGVVTLPSGLQYKILQAGTGAKPTAADTVVCNYKGTLINGTEFDSSYKRGEPATFPVGGVIKGWTEALQLMPTGSKWQLFIPSALAYGEHGAGQDIGPDATLVFEVEMISIQPKTAEKPQEPAAEKAPEEKKQ